MAFSGSRVSWIQRAAGAVVFVATLAAGCHSEVEKVPLVEDLFTARDRFFDVFTRDGKRVVIVGYGGKILTTDDGGEHWKRAAADTDKALMRVGFADEQRGWVVGQDGLVLRTDDGGQRWEAQRSGTERHLFGLAVSSRDRVFACGDRSEWIATGDGGSTWKKGTVPQSDVGMDPDIALAVGEPIYYDATFLDERTGWVVGDYGNIRFTDDGGRTWTSQHRSLLGQSMPGALRPLRDALDLPALFRIQMVSRERGMAAGVGGVMLQTEDGGGQWTIRDPGLSPRIEAPLLDMVDVNGRTLVLGGSAVALAGGPESWRRIDLELPVLTWLISARFASEGEFAGRRGFAVGGRGLVLRTDDGGDSWRPLGSRFPGQS